MRYAIMTYAAAWAFGNMYLIFLHDQMYQSGTSWAFISSSHSGFNPFPFRTLSMIVKESSLSSPLSIR